MIAIKLKIKHDNTCSNKHFVEEKLFISITVIECWEEISLLWLENFIFSPHSKIPNTAQVPLY